MTVISAVGVRVLIESEFIIAGHSRFVILTHDWPFLHWDLMLEVDDSLLTWRVLSEPQIGVELRIEPSPNHRKAYLDYEGPVSGERGCVSQWDFGQLLDLQVSDEFIEGRLSSTRFSCELNLNIHLMRQELTLSENML